MQSASHHEVDLDLDLDTTASHKQFGFAGVCRRRTREFSVTYVKRTRSAAMTKARLPQVASWRTLNMEPASSRSTAIDR